MATRAVTLAVCAWALLGPMLPSPAQAVGAVTERVELPAEGGVTLRGRGFGHGRGMSQHGALVAAERGVSFEEILAFYYPGTQLARQDDADIRVLLRAADASELQVVAAPGLQLVDAAGQGVALEFEELAASEWRVSSAGGSVRIAGFADGQWWDAETDLPLRFPVSLTTNSGAVRLALPTGERVDYLGAMLAVPDGSVLRVVNQLPMEQYLRSVVPAEMPAGWPAEALRAQAVAARTFASRERAEAGGRAWDVCDTVARQVYSGIGRHTAATDSAVAETAGLVLTYQGDLAFTQFSSSNGGWTGVGNGPYLIARPDPWDLANEAIGPWERVVTAAEIAAAYPEIGQPRAIVVTEREGNGQFGGRVLSVRVEGSAGSTEANGIAFQLALGLRSDWWQISGADLACFDPQALELPPIGPATATGLAAADTPAPWRLCHADPTLQDLLALWSG